MDEDRVRKIKGKFSRAGLPTAENYLYPEPRRRLLLAGLGVAGLAAALVLAGFFLAPLGWISAGPLSSAHAFVGQDCQVCHTSYAAVSDAKCLRCHESRPHLLGSYGWKAHLVYRSGDSARTSQRRGPECIACHFEHRGGRSLATEVPDRQCVQCHAFSPFAGRHPQFDFLAESQPDAAGLAFTHPKHQQEVTKRYQVEGEDACLYCHRPTSAGRSFESIDFDRICAACHLTKGTQTPPLEVASREDPIGVLPPEALPASVDDCRGDDILEAAAGIFERLDGHIQKMPLQHRDCWVLSNLERLRSLGESDAGKIGDPGRIADLVGRLLKPCLECHRATPAGIETVQRDQRVLSRAEFDHLAHAIQQDCLECHDRLLREEGDRSEVQHVPGIDSCRSCHRPGKTPDTCIECHFYHPDKDRRLESLPSPRRLGGSPP